MDLSAGKNTVTVTVTAQDGTTTKTYTVNVNQGVTAPFGWKAGDDLDGMIAAGNETPYAISSDGTTVWLSDIDDDKLYAYRLSDGERDTGADFDTLHAAGNRLSEGIWTDGTTMWAATPTMTSSTPTGVRQGARHHPGLRHAESQQTTTHQPASGPTAPQCG